MNKVFLYLYPIKEYTKVSLLSSDYDDLNKNPLFILNGCIQKRYRNKGFQVVFALYPDSFLYGINLQPQDKIIYTDILFKDATVSYSDGREKKNFIPKYPNEVLLINQLGPVDELVVGGYHFGDCVTKVSMAALNMRIDTLVDIDLTDLFFSLYKNEEYFKIEEYDPQRYRTYWYQKFVKLGEKKEFIDRQFQKTYNSPIYKFSLEEKQTLKRVAKK